MDKMSLIVFAKTGHVLGAFTRAAAPDTELAAAQVAGEGIWIRDLKTGERLLTVEPQGLKVVTVDRRDAVLLDHRLFAVVDGLPQEQNASLPTLARVGADLKLTVPIGAPSGLEAWVQVEGGPAGDRVLVNFEVPSGSAAGTDVLQALTLAAGSYAVLALVPGCRPALQKITFA